jgi:uncharacterized protein
MTIGALRQLVDAHREVLRAAARRHGAEAIWLVGSVARGEERPDSDLDFLVRLPNTASLFDLGAVHVALGEVLGRAADVDVLDETGVSREWLTRLRAEAVAL